jgi:hypothetical protein
MMELACDLTISFAAAGNSLAYLGGGWARSEPGFTWNTGFESHLLFPPLKPADEYILTLDVVPFTHAPEAPSQRLSICINDVIVGSCHLSRPTLLGYRIPAALIRQSENLVVTLQHPDAVRPKDFGDSGDSRHLAFALSEAKLYRVLNVDRWRRCNLPAGITLGSTPDRHLATLSDAPPMDIRMWATARTGLAIPDLAFRFESVGENCEFGLFQRRCDAEPLGLLRFSSTFMRNLIRGVQGGFADLGENEDIEPRLEGGPRKEFMIHEQKYGLVYHTFVYEGERSVWLIREQEAARLKFLRRKFVEELEAAEKIFVYRHRATTTVEEILPLHMALNRYGAATLLWVVPAEPGRPPGTVEVLMPGLMKGYIDRFAPDDNAHDLSFDGWLRLCANACVLHDLQARARSPEAGGRNA